MLDVYEMACVLGVGERRLRRAITDGAVRVRRDSERRTRVPSSERMYLQGHWPLLAELRAALRTEPNVRLAVLFGSSARGDDGPDSDVDIMVALTDPDRSRVYDLQDRLARRRLGRSVDVVLLEAAERAIWLLAEIATDGRVLVDRDGRWPRFARRRDALQREAAADLDARVEEALERVAAI